jgi:predicted lactoylglutathione lyase
MQLGAFSISLSVKDLKASQSFYEALGFTTMGDYSDQGWMILKNGDTIIGLFNGMFEGNMLTFNPGWDQNAKNLNDFDDVRTIQNHLKEAGIELTEEADPKGTGPAHITLKDPDGNVILIDQHR